MERPGFQNEVVVVASVQVLCQFRIVLFDILTRAFY